MPEVDIAFVGGGLANALIALRLRQARPDLKLVVLEAGEKIGGNHTWCFHGTDLAPSARAWVAPLVRHSWDGYDVHFTGHSRTLPGQYHCIPSDRLHEVVCDALGPAARTGCAAAELEPGRVVLRDGEVIDAGAVVDGRGPEASDHLILGFQKFLGQEWELPNPHGLTRPILMDATVAQEDGYRFVYVLPFSDRRLLIEDTYYADGGDVDPDALRKRIADYAAAKGWQEGRVIREEDGVLPILLAGDFKAFWAEKTDGLPTVGLRGGFFHATTGYSLPDAVRIADLIARQSTFGAADLSKLLMRYAGSHWRRQAFHRLLNRLLFLAATPEQRHLVMARFYRLAPGLIARFYAGRLTLRDRARILVGRPPITIRSALKVVPPKTAAKAR